MNKSNFPFNSMRFKQWRRRWSIMAPTMTITTRLPWPLRFLIFIVSAALTAAVALGIYSVGRNLMTAGSGADYRLSSLYKDQLERLNLERDKYSATVNSAESQLNIERSAQKQLANQVKLLEAENTRLKEDLAFFESLLPTGSGASGVNIRRMKVELVAPNQLRYRLLVMQGGKNERDFAGNLQMSVAGLQNGKNVSIAFPDVSSADAERFKLAFKHYQRVEGVLTVPDGILIKTVQARVLEKNQSRAQLSMNL